MKRLTSVLGVGLVLCCGLLFAACGGSSDNPPVTEDGDTEADSDLVPVDGDAVEGEESADDDSEVPGDVPWLGTKCPSGTNNPEGDVAVAVGGLVQMCTSGDAIDGASASVPKNILAGDIHVKLEKADDIVLAGWKPIGPAVRFLATSKAAGGVVKLTKGDVKFLLPYDAAKRPGAIKDYYINVVFVLDKDNAGVSANNNNAPFLLPKTPGLQNVNHQRQYVEFKNNYFGTYQAVIPSETPSTLSRHYVYRAIGGISMGAGGGLMPALQRPEEFDILAPLGGIMDMTYLVGLMHDFHLGGFCTYEQIKAQPDLDAFLNDLNGKCGYEGEQHNPLAWSQPFHKTYMTEPRAIYSYYNPKKVSDEHAQGYNHWYFDNSGGAFDRTEYVKLFRDLSYAFGNPSNYNSESPYLAVGLKGERLQKFLTDIYNPADVNGKQEAACEKLAEWMKNDPVKGLYDREYNPDGSLPAIYFCDGRVEETGDYDPANAESHARRVDIAVAIDYNGNGIRDFGEPLIRQFSEPYEDCGTDGLCDKDEPGYNATTNPDPNHDDYNPYTNPSGTENNGQYDVGEKYQDLGLDGVKCPEGKTCEFDYGEGNGKFDYNPNVLNFLAHDPRSLIHAMPKASLKRLNFYVDGGIRDIFNFGLMGDNLIGALHRELDAENVVTKSYGDFFGLLNIPADSYAFARVNWAQAGSNVQVRYGNYEATDDSVRAGDGCHVGTTAQVVYRLQSLYGYMDAHFPNGDYAKVDKWNVNTLIRKVYYESKSLKRAQRFGISLPPGYETKNTAGTNGAPDTCVNRYPVLYLLHGYGQEPVSFAPAVAVLFPNMAAGTMQKIITIFPDGRCYDPDTCKDDCNDDCKTTSGVDEACSTKCQTDRNCATTAVECVKGTFYADHPAILSNPTGKADDTGFKAGMNKSALYDLMEYVDSHFCTKKAEDVTVDSKTLDGVY